jgi:hypothetical protein
LFDLLDDQSRIAYHLSFTSFYIRAFASIDRSSAFTRGQLTPAPARSSLGLAAGAAPNKAQQESKSTQAARDNCQEPYHATDFRVPLPLLDQKLFGHAKYPSTQHFTCINPAISTAQ